MNDTTIAIEGMHCDGCAQRVQRVLEQERGVREVQVSYADGAARVMFDERATAVQRLREVVERAGYTVRAGAKGA